jgi:hypothetical protein
MNVALWEPVFASLACSFVHNKQQVAGHAMPVQNEHQDILIVGHQEISCQQVVSRSAAMQDCREESEFPVSVDPNLTLHHHQQVICTLVLALTPEQ